MSNGFYNCTSGFTLKVIASGALRASGAAHCSDNDYRAWGYNNDTPTGIKWTRVGIRSALPYLDTAWYTVPSDVTLTPMYYRGYSDSLS